MERVFTETERRFGRIDGVLHLASYNADRLRTPLADLTADVCRAPTSSRRWRGPPSWRRSPLADRSIGVSFSSLSTELGGLGFCAYSAANHAMSAIANNENLRGPARWINVRWDGWRFDTRRSGEAAAVDDYSLDPEEGVDAFARIVAGRADDVIVSTADLDRRLAMWRPLRVETPPERAGTSASPDEHARQEAGEDPLAQTERIIARIWEEVLGVASVKRDDNFFTLGGDSLLGLQVVARIRATFQVDVSPPP